MNNKNNNTLVIILVILVFVLLGILIARSGSSTMTSSTDTADQTSMNADTGTTANTGSASTSKAVAVTNDVSAIVTGGCAARTNCPNPPLKSSVTLNGTFNGTGSSVTTWFQYWELKGSSAGTVLTTPKTKQSAQQGTASAVLAGLPNGQNYLYRFVVEDAAGINYGSDKSFVIPFAGL